MPTRAHAPFSDLQFPAIETEAVPSAPILPSSWQCTALLHPFSPPPANDPLPTTPFFQLCIATIRYIEGQIFSAQLTGLDYGGTWWYKIDASNATTVSTDQGATWTLVTTGWTLPTTNWLSDAPVFFASTYLNWMQAQLVDWWKQPVPNSPATTWTWFNSSGAGAGLPVRMMFGAPPPTPATGDGNQLALFQNFSFTYFPTFEATSTPVVDSWTPPDIAGFQRGNPNNYQLVVWDKTFGMVTLMTPVDSASFPLPTLVYYQWLADAAYKELTDRAQRTMMSYIYNPKTGIDTQQAFLYGAAPNGVTPPPNAGNGYLYQNMMNGGSPTCISFGFGEEPPWWARIKAVDGTIHACVTNNPTLCPNEVVTIISVLFPPSTEYPQGRYLWTWYSPFPGSNGSHARPVTFMESASTIAEGGTSLALADYFVYKEVSIPIPSSVLALPAICANVGPGAPTG